MAPMTRVVSFKIPEEAKDLQSRLSIASKKAGVAVWELMCKMLDLLDQQSEELVGDGWKEWRGTVETELQSLRTEIEALKVQKQEPLDQNAGIPVGDASGESVKESKVDAVDQDQPVKTKPKTRKRRKEDS